MEDLNKPTLPVHYIKDESYRTFFASGVIGGLNSIGQVNLNFYLDRLAIPTKQILEVNQLGESTEPKYKLGNVVGTEIKDGWVREVSVGMVMSVDTARAVAEWLNRQVEEFDKLHVNK
jgi:hypothetical protein